MSPSTKQATIAKLMLGWAIINLTYIVFAIWTSGLNSTPWTKNDIIANTVKIALDSAQLVLAVMLVRHFRIWMYRLSLALIPISIAVFWLLPL